MVRHEKGQRWRHGDVQRAPQRNRQRDLLQARRRRAEMRQRARAARHGTS